MGPPEPLENRAGKQEQLEQLHFLLTDHFLSLLQAGNLTAAELTQVRQFLRDNGIECARRDARMRSIAELAPTFEDEEEAM